MSRVLRALGALLPGRFARPVPSPEVTTCAAGCGQPLLLGELHYSVVRSLDRETSRGVDVVDGDVMASVHVDCWLWPGQRVVLDATALDPQGASLREVSPW